MEIEREDGERKRQDERVFERIGAGWPIIITDLERER